MVQDIDWRWQATELVVILLHPFTKLLLEKFRLKKTR
jgi:hypothetical protein